MYEYVSIMRIQSVKNHPREFTLFLFNMCSDEVIYSGEEAEGERGQKEGREEKRKAGKWGEVKNSSLFGLYGEVHPNGRIL